MEFPSLLDDSNFYHSFPEGEDPERHNLYSNILQNGIFFTKKIITIQTPTFQCILCDMCHCGSLVCNLRVKKSAEKSVYKGQEQKTGGAPHWEASSLN